MISFTLPYPPSANRYYRHLSKGPMAGRTLISEEGRRYRKAVIHQARLERIRQVTGRLRVELVAHPPDHRRRDLDNVLKAALDSMTHAGIIVDDSHIDYLMVARGAVWSGGGAVLVSISECGSAAPQTAELFDAMDEAVPF